MSKEVAVTLDSWREAFMKAENETGEHFGGKTCSIQNKDGQWECPICYFSILMKKHLGIE